MKVLAEFLGSMMFMSVIAFGQNPLVIGFALMVMVYAWGHISGAHFNPAVTLALAMNKKMERKDVVPYMLAQCLGAICAFLIGRWITGEQLAIAPGSGVDVMQAIFVEAIFTMMLVLVIFNVATAKRNAGNSFYGLAIGGTVFAIASAGGGISGGAFNPAVAVGATVVDGIFGSKDWSNLWLYFVGPGLGAIVAAFLYPIVNPETE